MPEALQQNTVLAVRILLGEPRQLVGWKSQEREAEPGRKERRQLGRERERETKRLGRAGTGAVKGGRAGKRNLRVAYLLIFLHSLYDGHKLNVRLTFL